MKARSKYIIVVYWLYLILLLSFVHCNQTKDQSIRQTNQQILPLPISKTKLGIGLVHMNLNSQIPLYRSNVDTIAYDTITFKVKDNGTDKGICLFLTKNLKDRLSPYTLYKGDSDTEAEENLNMGLIRFIPELIFRVMERDSAGATIMINEQGQEMSYIRLKQEDDLNLHKTTEINYFDPNFVSTDNQNWYYFEYWEEALKRAFYITIPANTMIFDKPNGNPIHLDLSAYFRIDKIDMEWAHIESADIGIAKKEQGWIRWKNNDKIVLEYQLNGGYE